MSLAGIWTAKGIDKLAAQTAGGAAVSITRIALGDGGGIVPTVLPSQTALFNEKWRGNVNSVLIEKETPNAVIVEAVIPYTVGGWHIREWALLDNDGDMIAVGPHAEFYKPLLSEGSGAELLERIQLPIANAGQISLTISSDALATRKFAEATATAKAKEEVARHDGDVLAHGGLLGALEVVAEASNAHINNFNNPHKIPNATHNLYGLVKPDGVTTYISTEGGLLAASPDMPWRPLENYRAPCLRLGSDGSVYLWKKASGPAVAGVGAKDPTVSANGEYWLDYAASITPPIPTPYPIGIPMEWRSTTLGENMVWADRGAIYFADWPEFKALYDNNGFAGMVLPANANVTEQQAQLGKWALLPDSLGLLTPDRRGQFVRGWGHGQTVDVGREAGSWQSDEFKSHSHNYYIGGIYTNAASGNARTEVTGMTISTSNTGGSETRAKNIAVPTAIYMGSSASAFPYKAVYYNIATQKDNTI